jgi:lysine-N-methylase
MPEAHMVRQPRYFDRFRCIGAECEDTCCNGWGILVDAETWEKYQSPLDFRIAGKALSSLVEINPASSSSIDYAKMRLEGTACPALNEGLCSIQRALGERYIPDLCSTYPRVLNRTGPTVEKSLHLSCPEAARLVLSDPEAMALSERMEESLPHRAGSLTVVAGTADDGLNRVRTLMIEVIGERSLPLWQRIVSLEFAIDKIAGADAIRAVGIMEGHLSGLRQGLFQGIFASRQAAPAFQLETVLELIVARLRADYTSPRFLDCYGEFMRGLAWTNESTMEELAARYRQASENHFQPFVRRHEHLLENYLVNYIFRTLFPYRRKQSDQTFAIDSGKESIKNAFLLLAAHYAIIRTVLIGMASFHKDDLGIEHAVKLVQSYSKAFLHSSSFETAAVDFLKTNAECSTKGIAALVMD